MSSVDERVVELRFDNKQFEDGVKTSLGTLDKLKQGLNIDKSAKSLDGLKTATKGFNMSSVENAVDAVTNKFSVLGTIGDQVLRNLTNSALNLGKNIITAIPNQIISGGKRRAQNIEQAQFQLKGLLGEEYDWDKISEDLDYAVAGTAYGLDQAAKVAAQLKASNIDFGEDMKGALRGISGVAAMTNSSYDDIGRIFAKIAGNGRVMTEELNQFAGRGLNVAAELAKVYNVSEAELREMVTKGQVDFRTFAEAMNDAFGEHATKANETFSGALSNIKASLSRMGAKFATPIYEKLRDLFNAILPIMKGFEKLLNPVAEKFKYFLNVISVPIGGALEKTKNAFEGFLIEIGLMDPTTKEAAKGVKQLGDVLTGTAESAKDITKVVEDVINGVYGNGEVRKKALTELGYSYAAVQNRVNELLGSSKRYDEGTEGHTRSAYKNAKANKIMAERLGDVGLALDEQKDVFEGLDPTLAKIGRTLLGIASAFGIIKQFGAALWKQILSPVLRAGLPVVLGGILSITSAIGQKLIDLNRSLKDSDYFNKKLAAVANVLREIWHVMQKVGHDVTVLFSIISKSDSVQNLVDKFNKLKNVLGKSIGSAIGFISNKLKTLFDLFTGKGKSSRFAEEYGDNGFFNISLMEKAKTVITGLIDGLALIIDTLANGITTVETFFKSFTFKAPSLSGITDFLGKIKDTEGIGRLVGAFKSLKDVIADIARGALGFIGEKLGEIPGLFNSIDTSGSGSTFVSVIDNIANILAIIVETASGGIGAVKNFFGSFTISDGFTGNLEHVKEFFKTVGGVSASKLTELKDAIVGIFKAGDGSKSSGLTTAISGVNKAFSSIGGDPKVVKAQAKTTAEAFGEGLLEGLAKINLDTIFKGVKVGALVYLVLQVAGMFKNLKNAAKDVSVFVKNISKLPKNVNKTLEKLCSTLTTYQNDLRSDILLKVAAAIGILALSIVALSFIDPQKVANIAVDLSLVIGMIALLVLALSKIQQPKIEGKVDPLTQGLNNFLSGIQEMVKKAVSIVSKAAAFTLIAAAFLLIVKAVNEFIQIDFTVGKAVQVIVGMLAMAAMLYVLAAKLDKLKNLDAGTGIAILGIALAVKKLSDVVVVFSSMDPIDLAKGLLGVVAILGMFTVMGKVLSSTGDKVGSASKGLLAMVAALLILTPIVLLFGSMAKQAAIGAVIVSILGGVMVALTAVAGAIGREFQGNAIKGAAAMVVLAAAIALLAPTLILLGTVAKQAFIGVGIIAAALGVLLGAAAIAGIPTVTAGLAALSGVMLAFGSACLSAGAGVALFAVGVAILVAVAPVIFEAIQNLFSNIGELISRLPELAGNIVSGIGALFGFIWQAIITYAPILLEGLLNLIGQLPGWIVTQLPNIIAGIIALTVKIFVAIQNIFASLGVLIPALLKGLVQGIVKGVSEAAGPIGNGLKGLLMGFINLIVDGLSGFAQKLGPAGAWISDKLEGWRSDMQEKLKPEESQEIGEQYGEGLAKGVENGSGLLERAFGHLTDGTEETGKEMSEQGETYGKEFMHQTAKGVKDNENEAVNVMNDFWTSMSGAADGTEMSIDVPSMITDSIQNGDYGDVGGALKDTLAPVLQNGFGDIDISGESFDLGAAIPEGLSGGILSNSELPLGDLEQLTNSMTEGVRSDLGINSPSKVFADIGEGVPEGMAKGITQASNQVDTSLNQIVNAALNTVRPMLTQFAVIGRAMSNNMASGIRNGIGAVRSAAASLASAAKSGASSGSMYATGVDVANGFIRGLDSKLPAIRAAGKRAFKAYHDNAEKAGEVGSPSRVMRRTGRFMGDGFILGLNDRLTGIAEAGRNAAGAAIDATKTSLQHVNSIISGELDMDPTIRPVLDLSDVKKGAGTINSLLPQNSLGLSFAVAGNAPGSSYRASNDDVVNAINSLRDDLVNTPRNINNYSVGDVSYDDGSNMATAVRSLIRAAKTERRA